VSSGCIRMLNEDVMDLYDRVQVGTRVVVLPNAPAYHDRTIARTQSPGYAAPAPVPVATSRGFRPSGLFGIY